MNIDDDEIAQKQITPRFVPKTPLGLSSKRLHILQNVQQYFENPRHIINAKKKHSSKLRVNFGALESLESSPSVIFNTPLKIFFPIDWEEQLCNDWERRPN